MCTALTLKSKDGFHFFGRNMDLEYSFNQSVILVPRKYQWENVISKKILPIKYAILGMGVIINNHPLLADGLNEKGLACAGLNFPNYCYHSPEPYPDKINIGPYDFILWILSNFETVEEVKAAVSQVNLVNIPFALDIALPTLHWIVYDKQDQCIVIEQTKEKFCIFENKIGVLTNPPTFDWHIDNLKQYIHLSSKWVEGTTWYKQELNPDSCGLGLVGIPGDFYPPARFVRVAYLKSHATHLDNEMTTLAEFYHILNNVAMPGGAVIKPKSKEEFTLYTSCMALEKGVYYYSTYNNLQLNAIAFEKEDLDQEQLKSFEYLDTLSINNQN